MGNSQIVVLLVVEWGGGRGERKNKWRKKRVTLFIVNEAGLLNKLRQKLRLAYLRNGFIFSPITSSTLTYFCALIN